MSNKNGPAIKAKSFLIVCFRFIGDVLVTTPLAYSISQAFPHARIDYLIFEGTEGVLANNPNISNVITLPRDQKNLKHLASLFRSYDVAIAANISDRACIAAAIAGKYSVGFTRDSGKEWWKGYALNATVNYDDGVHVVWNLLMLLSPLDIVPLPRMVVNYGPDEIALVKTLIPASDYVLLHPYSKGSYKYWPVQHWGQLAGMIRERLGYTVVFTTTPVAEDQNYLKEILASAPATTQVMRSAGSLTQLAACIGASKAFIGVDTAVTHMAGAIGVPVFALYGSSWTQYWAPWPNDVREKSPFAANKGIQTVSNVTVIQKDWECVPCNKEICRISSRNRVECLDELSVEEVFNVILERLRKTP